MTHSPRRVLLMLFLSAMCVTPVFAQQVAPENSSRAVLFNDSANSELPYAPSGGGITRPTIAYSVNQSWFLRHFGIGSDSGTLGLGGEVAASLTRSLNLRAGANYFTYSTAQSADGIPFTANLVLQSEQASVDWYPFHRSKFHISPGMLFAGSNRGYGSASIAAGDSFTLDEATYISGAADPVHASGSVRFPRSAPSIMIGWGNWIRQERQRHLSFPFEFGAAYMGDPKTALSFSGEVCSNQEGQLYCDDVASDAEVQANIAAERRKMQDDANYVRFYPILSGGAVYRF